MSAPVVCRFAPSPTGFLHIGGARTALFNWAYARGRGGKLVLRIEDTDRARSNEAAVDAILDGLTWLGIDWDGEPVSQFSRADRHREVVETLLENGGAYRCYMTPAELAEAREAAQKAGTAFRYDGRWRDRDPAEAPPGVDPVIRLKVPLDGETVVEDRVQGRVAVPNETLDDFVILRSDGTPVYLLSVVVDDHDMGITHVIRGDDHLTNAAKQSLLFQALGWPVPVMAHIPLIHGPDGAKLSKRHGALGIEAYRDMGYLPEALRNYLARLGWSHGDDEIFTTDDLLAWFDLDGIGKAPARIDFKKMENLNAHYLREADDQSLADALRRWIVSEDDQPAFEKHLDRFIAALPILKTRAKSLVDLYEIAGFLVAERPIVLSEKAAGLLDADGRRILGDLSADLSAIADWNRDAIEQAVNGFVERENAKFGKIAQPVRAALTGSTASPSIIDILTILGRSEAIGRLEDCVSGTVR
ncbi:MAG: glutamate--tRNA ligase [Pseudomonadota bacterium]